MFWSIILFQPVPAVIFCIRFLNIYISKKIKEQNLKNIYSLIGLYVFCTCMIMIMGWRFAWNLLTFSMLKCLIPENLGVVTSSGCMACDLALRITSHAEWLLMCCCQFLASFIWRSSLSNSFAEAEKVVGWAKNHYLSSCNLPLIKGERLYLPRGRYRLFSSVKIIWVSTTLKLTVVLLCLKPWNCDFEVEGARSYIPKALTEFEGMFHQLLSKLKR